MVLLQTQRVLLTLILMFSLVGAFSGCHGEVPDEKRQAVFGEVTWDEGPVKLALITFRPVGETTGPVATGRVEDGKYRIEATKGPHAGKFRVIIETITQEMVALAEGRIPHGRSQGPPEPIISREFNSDSEIVVEIVEGAENRHDFKVKMMGR